MVDGVQFTPQNGLSIMVPLIDFETPENNIFRVVNQFTVEYINNGQRETRRPDVLLFVNGMPLCVIELKNPADANATIYDAWEQITIRYWRDIPQLLHYCPLACISDGVKTRLGTVRTPYEHFYAWRRVNDGDKLSTCLLRKPKPWCAVSMRRNAFWKSSATISIFRMRFSTAMNGNRLPLPSVLCSKTAQTEYRKICRGADRQGRHLLRRNRVRQDLYDGVPCPTAFAPLR